MKRLFACLHNFAHAVSHSVFYPTLCLILLALLPHPTTAQCRLENTAFASGESLTYNLYFNWSFVWIKVGTASMNISDTRHDSAPAYRCNLITRSNGRADKLFMMRDTLQSIVTHDLVPLYYRKGANEGGQYRVDEVWYTYNDGKTHMKQRYLNRHGKVKTQESVSPECVYDMVSMLLRARSFDGSQYKKGDRIHFLMADGDEVEPQILVFRGKKDFKMEDSDIRYRCLVFSFVEVNKKGKEKEVITFYVTDDANHLPVRLDMYLRFGTAKAFLTDTHGVKNPQDAIIKK